MGHMNAMGMAAAVEDGTASARQALYWHLTANHYPGMPGVWVDGALEAIEAGNEGDWDREITLPAAGIFAEQTHTAGTLIEGMHLDAFLSEWEAEEILPDDDDFADEPVDLDDYEDYVDECHAENLDAHSYEMWVVHGRPSGPLG